MVLLDSAGSGAVFDAVDDMAKRRKEYWAALCIGFAGGMCGIGNCNDGSVPGKRCGEQNTIGTI